MPPLVVSPPPDRHPKTPRLELLPGACDCHFHIFGPQARFPLASGRRLEVEDCTLDDLIALQNALGLSRGLLVQSFQHGQSYEYMLHALCREPARLRGVAIPASDSTDRELEILTKAGVVGVRFGFKSNPTLDLGMIARTHELGWHPHYLLHGEAEIEAWGAHILASPGRFVLDHMGYPDIAKGVKGLEFQFVRRCLDTGRCWVKLSPRFTREKTLPFADTLPFIHALVEAVPDRLLWGSDWPHPNYFDPMPNDADLLDLMLDWVPDEAVRHRIFVDNPAEIFGFGTVGR
jgi:2-pyrone-4,6-dicarboxylate lactonase